MPPERVSRVEQARLASADEIKALLHEPGEEILAALLRNPNFCEAHAELLLERLDLSANVLSAIAREGEWLASEGVRLRMARHPRTPKRLAFAVVRQLFLFDLVRLSLTPAAPADVRRVAEELILARLPHLPVGQKLTLARDGPARVAGAILAEGHPQALKLALGNAFLTESQLLRILAKAGVADRVIIAIARHPKWSRQYNVRAALIRNPAAPEEFVGGALMDITLRDLKDFSELRELSQDRRKMIAEELQRRMGKQVKHATEVESH